MDARGLSTKEFKTALADSVTGELVEIFCDAIYLENYAVASQTVMQIVLSGIDEACIDKLYVAFTAISLPSFAILFQRDNEEQPTASVRLTERMILIHALYNDLNVECLLEWYKANSSIVEGESDYCFLDHFMQRLIDFPQLTMKHFTEVKACLEVCLPVIWEINWRVEVSESAKQQYAQLANDTWLRDLLNVCEQRRRIRRRQLTWSPETHESCPQAERERIVTTLACAARERAQTAEISAPACPVAGSEASPPMQVSRLPLELLFSTFAWVAKPEILRTTEAKRQSTSKAI